jgi:DNA-binding beta-propeller fold protein YncE
MTRAAIRLVVCMLGCLALPLARGALPQLREIALPGAQGLVTLDYFAWDAARRRLWVPAGNTARVVVIDAATNAITSLPGFETREFTLGGRRGRLGPSSVTFGEGVAYVGNRADSSLCTIDAVTLRRGECIRVGTAAEDWSGAPDGVVYVPATKEVWVTRGAPPLGIASADRAISVYDASNPRALKASGKVALEASAEGYAVDAKRGRFYTNLEETKETVAIDLRSRAVVARWKSGCDEARGLALDEAAGLLFVACSARVVVLDAAHGGEVKGTLDTGKGLDNIDYSPAERLLYAAASLDATLTVARVAADGSIAALEVVQTVRGARGVVAGDAGTAFVADPAGGRILVLTFPAAKL